MNTQVIDRVFGEWNRDQEDVRHAENPSLRSAEQAETCSLFASHWLSRTAMVGGIVLTVVFLVKAFAGSPAPKDAAVSSEQQATKKIEDIRAGDWVLAEDPLTGIKKPKRVLDAYKRRTNHLYIVTLAGSDGSQQTIKTTSEHPFWVEGTGWVNASELQPGQKLRQTDGKIAYVRSNKYQAHPEGVDVFNFQVEDYHTYFVAANGIRGPPVLVHNAECPYFDANALRWRDPTTGQFVARPPGGGWRLGSNHSTQTWSNQMASRGWTPQQISQAIANGKRFPATNNVNPGNTATRYVHPTTGRSVVIDEVTGEVIHIGGDGFLY